MLLALMKGLLALAMPAKMQQFRLTMRLAVSTTAGKPVITGLNRSCNGRAESAYYSAMHGDV